MLLLTPKCACRKSLKAWTNQKFHVPMMWAKLFWLTMAISHAPGLIVTWRRAMLVGCTFDALLPCLLLIASMIFFLFKIGNVRFMETTSDRRACLIFCILIGMMHVDISRASAERAIVVECTETLALTLVASRMIFLRHESKPSWSSNDRHASILSGHCRAARIAWLDSFPTHSWFIVHQALHERAPPV